jgi:hypothetical protein
MREITQIIIFRFFFVKEFKCKMYVLSALDGLAVSVFVTGPTGHSVAGSNPTEGGGFLWVVKIRSAHFLRRGSKAVGPMS